MFNLLKEIHRHSLELEDSLAGVPENVASSKAIERTFGLMGGVLLVGGYLLAMAGIENEFHHISEFAARQEATVIDVAKMGLIDPLLMTCGGVVGYSGLEDIAVANGLRRRRREIAE